MGSTTIKTFANVSSGSTASTVVPAVAGFAIKVISVAMQAGATATNVTFNSGSTAISATFSVGINGYNGLGHNSDGWFVTSVGAPLTVTTGAGSTVGMQIVYILDNS